ncbi:COG4315 family predicted lipoprotein [Maritalea sp.]|uniref:COG4315 family predicted lipoprotein n=1 Tax=Maritalea sp. TaxID=2003361 RepID=UPI003EF15430
MTTTIMTKTIISKISAAALMFASIGGIALAAGHIPVQKYKTDMGEVLADKNNMTLYTFDKDSDGVSNCYDQCAQNWPPLFAEEDEHEGDYSVVARNDGTKVWAYKGQPLYLWVGDSEPGDVSGDGVGGVWHVAKPSMY